MKSDLSLDYSIGQKYLTWIVGLFSVIITMVLTIFFAIYEPHTAYEVQPNFTVGVPFVNQQAESAVEKVYAHLKSMPGVTGVSQVEKNELVQLLTPRMLDADEVDGIDLPTFFDVTTDSSIDQDKLKQELRSLLPGISVEPYKQWRELIQSQHNSFQILAGSCVLVIMVMIMLLVNLITKVTISSYLSVVDTLRLIGAVPSFICKQFQTKNLISCLKGGSFGLVVGLGFVYGISFIPQLLGMTLSIKPLLSVHFIPIFAMLLFMITLIGIVVSRSMINSMIKKLEK